MLDSSIRDLQDPSDDTMARRFLKRRRGLSTAWLLMFGPVFMVLLGLVLEIGNIYVAQSQLENAMEAAALAAVKEWGGAAPSNDWTLVPREIGTAYGNANEVAGQRLGDFAPMMNLNYQVGGTSNNNASCTGDLVFGAVSFEETSEGTFDFDANVEPSCTVTTSGTATIIFSIDTNRKGADCTNPGDKQGTTTFRCLNAWEFEFIEATGGAVGTSIVAISIDLQATGSGSGQFDFDTTANPPNQEIYDDDDRQGYGPFFSPQSDGILSGDVTFFQDAAGTVSIPSNSTGQSSVLTIRIQPGAFQEGDKLVFGVDTDMVDPFFVGNQGDTRDDGGAFKVKKQSNFAISFYFGSFEEDSKLMILGTDDQVLSAANKTFLNKGRAKDLTFEIPGEGNFAVRASKTISIPSLCGGVLGIYPSFTVYAESTAMWRCGFGDVSLIRLRNFACSIP